jgi:hypothetical protein
MRDNEARLKEAQKFQIAMYLLAIVAFYLGTQGLLGLPGFSTDREINLYGIGFGIFLAAGGTAIRFLYKQLKLSEEIAEENERNRRE